MSPDTHPHLAGGAWIPGSGEFFSAWNPATGEVSWEGAAAGTPEIDRAFAAAADAFPGWSSAPLSQRIQHLERFAAALSQRSDDLTETISLETGKPRWEAKTETSAMASKIALTIQAQQERRRPLELASGNEIAATRYKPHGIAAVLGPFNLPGHLPNAHLVPALLAGNCVVFKPSEHTPRTGRLLTELWLAAGLAPGVFSLLQGGRATGELVVRHPAVNAIYFTGGVAAGRAIARARAETPEVILALELGGNNPLVVWEPCAVTAAVYHTLVSAFITSGQRCACARRLILPDSEFGELFLRQLVAAAARLRSGPPDSSPEPFLGPVISATAADRILHARDSLLRQGARELLRMERYGHALLSPGILDVTGVTIPDEEIFGPMLQVIRCRSFAEAIREANHTAFGLCAGLLCEARSLWGEFFAQARAGIVNWNKPLTGASGAQPFGGIGWSGNHRPSGYFAVDYCSYPVASLETPALTLPANLVPGIELEKNKEVRHKENSKTGSTV